MDDYIFKAFFAGACFTAIGDVFFSVANYFVQRALKERAIRRAVKKQSTQEHEQKKGGGF